jgi:hypothetical protein
MTNPEGQIPERNLQPRELMPPPEAIASLSVRTNEPSKTDLSWAWVVGDAMAQTRTSAKEFNLGAFIFLR